MVKKIIASGINKGSDPYHNEYLDTGDMLLNGFIGNAKNKNLIKQGGEEMAKQNNDASLNLVDKNIARKELESFQEKIVHYIDDMRADLISLYQINSDKKSANGTERVIKKAEKILDEIGYEYEEFNPLKIISGLQSGEVLDNAKKVAVNTANYYKMFGISNIECQKIKNKPALLIDIFGEVDDVGIEVEGVIEAKDDFGGNEAIDYVYSDSGGLMTVKSKIAGFWKDVSEQFNIQFKIKRYKLEKNDKDGHSLFIGEKNLKIGKEHLINTLNKKKEEVKFSKCRIFSENLAIIKKVEEIIKINK